MRKVDEHLRRAEYRNGATRPNKRQSRIPARVADAMAPVEFIVKWWDFGLSDLS